MVRLAANLSFLFTEYPFVERFRHAAAAGFKAVECLFPFEHPAERLRAELKAHGLKQVLFNAPPGDWPRQRGLGGLPGGAAGGDAAFEQSVEVALSYAEALSCPTVHVLAGLRGQGASEATFVRRLRWAAERAQPAGIRLCLEALNARDMPDYLLGTSDDALRLVDQVDRPNVGLQLDLYHVQVAEGDVSTKIARACGSGRLFHVQIANPPGRHEPGVGELDIPNLLAELDSHGYEGYVGCEYKPSSGDTLASLTWARPFGIAPSSGR